MIQNIDNFTHNNWMDSLYHSWPASANLLFFDQLSQALIIDDPQMAFYLKKISFSTLAKQVGKIANLAERKVFISYSHHTPDPEWLDRLKVHLKPVEREGIIDLWDDTRIDVGIEWKEAIKDALETARAAILLVSANFLASDFITEHELPTLLEQAKAGGTTIVPIILSPCLYSSTSLGAFKALNSPDRPLSDMSYSDQEKVLMKAAQIIMDRFKAE